MTRIINVVYYGDFIYSMTGTMFPSTYRDKLDTSFNWGDIQRALDEGEEIHIRQATAKEMRTKMQKLRKLGY